MIRTKGAKAGVKALAEGAVKAMLEHPKTRYSVLVNKLKLLARLNKFCDL
jgi:hypothetical protein